VYVRNRLKPLARNNAGIYPDHVYLDAEVSRKLTILASHRPPLNYGVKYLVVAGKFYLLAKPGGTSYYGMNGMYDGYTVLNQTRHADLIDHLCKPSWLETTNYEFYVGAEDPTLIEISRNLNAPVFVIEGYQWDHKTNKTQLRINSEIPILSTLGFPSFYAPEQLYQDLAYFMGNKIKTSPDLAPPVEVSNKDRIVQHGFDLKASFRHRKPA
jgi:hypothetical protein